MERLIRRREAISGRTYAYILTNIYTITNSHYSYIAIYPPLIDVRLVLILTVHVCEGIRNKIDQARRYSIYIPSTCTCACAFFFCNCTFYRCRFISIDSIINTVLSGTRSRLPRMIMNIPLSALYNYIVDLCRKARIR